MSRTRKVVAYLLGQGHATGADGQPLFSWPYRVDYTPSAPGGDFTLSEGDGRNGGGASFHARQVLEPRWRAHLELAGVLWLVPILEQIARGEDVQPQQVLAAYEAANGEEPRREVWHMVE